MSKELRNKKDGLVKQLKDLNEKLKVEGRASFSADEKSAFEKIKADLSGVKDQLEAFELQEGEEKAEAERAFKANPTPEKRSKDEFGTFLRELRSGKFQMSMEEFEQRATVTTATNSHFKFTDMKEGVSISEPELVLESLGGQLAFFKEGNVAYPALTHIVGSFGVEDTSVSDQALTTAQVVLSPVFVSASLEVSKSFIVQSKKKNIDDLKNALVYAVKKAVEKEALKFLSGATAATGSTSFARAIQAESLIIGSGTGIIAGKNAVKKMKQEKIDSGSGIMTWTNNEVNGYPAKRSILTPHVDSVIYGDLSSVVMAYFGDEITIEVLTDGTMARKGNVLIIASAMAGAKCVDLSKLSYFAAP